MWISGGKTVALFGLGDQDKYLKSSSMQWARFINSSLRVEQSGLALGRRRTLFYFLQRHGG